MKKRIEGMISGINQYVSNPQSLLKDFYIRQKTLFVARLNFLENLRTKCQEMYSENKLLYLEETQLIEIEQFEQDLRQTLSTHDLSVVENFDIVF